MSPKICGVFERKDIVSYLESRHLLKQYKKAKHYLLSGGMLHEKFKERYPNGSGIWSFRINKQFRALGVFDEDDNLVIFKIDNHQ
jgi:plasmid maintenance system killer protein